jgi:hypothetical protein
MRTLGRATILAAAIAAALFAVPAAARAAVTCDYSSVVQLLEVDLSAAGDVARLEVMAGEITVTHQGVTPITCTGPGGPPTVTNTDAIGLSGDAANQAVVINRPNEFVPGADPEVGSGEIEIFANLNGAPGSVLQLVESDAGGTTTFGSGGINANAVGEQAPRDADIIPTNVERVAGLGGAGNDELYAQGGIGTGGPVTSAMTLNGREGSDLLTGGEGADAVRGGPGEDTLFGMGGDDDLVPGEGNDSTVNGGPGSDTLVVGGFDPVTIDLAIVGPQDTGYGVDSYADVENAAAFELGEATLRGDDGPNVLTGSALGDTLEGRGSVDVLVAGEGPDTLDVRDGGPDTADCGDGIDTVMADGPGIDTLTGCESVVFPPPTDPGGGGGGGAGGGGGGQVLTPAFGSRTLVTIGLAAKRIRRRGPLAVRISNANGFEVSGVLSGRALKRRARLRGRPFVVPANARRIVRLRLPKALRRQLVRRRKLALRLTAQIRDPAGSSRTVAKRVRPRLKRSRRAPR